MLVKLGPWPFPRKSEQISGDTGQNEQQIDMNRAIEEDADHNLESASNRFSMTDLSMQEGHPDLVRIGSRVNNCANERGNTMSITSNVGAENMNQSMVRGASMLSQ